MWLRPLAIAVLATLLAGPAYVVSHVLSDLLISVAALSALWAIYQAIRPRFRSRDPYSLGELRRVHEEEERRALEPETELIAASSKVLCSRCRTEYDSRLRACPNCGAGG